jgi:hypothetical protein
MPTPHPNKTNMDAAVARWIADAARLPGGSALLRRKAEWVAAQIARLGRDDLDTPEHLEGLTVFDLLGAQGDLDRAARGLPPLVREPFTQIVFGHHHDGAIVYFASDQGRPGVDPPYGTLDASVPDGHRFVSDRGRHLLLQMVAVAQAEAA